MDRYGINGLEAQLAEYETPFANIPLEKEEAPENTSTENLNLDFLAEMESPFFRTYESSASASVLSPASEDFVQLTGELNNLEFTNTLYELASELEDSWVSKISNETAMGDSYMPFVSQQAEDYFMPLYRESESMIDIVSHHFSGNDLTDHSKAEVKHLILQRRVLVYNSTPFADYKN